MHLESLLELALLVLALEATYQSIISLFGLAKPQPARPRPPRHTFAIFVPAHNEASVIGATVRSLIGLAYPKVLFAIYVIADHCNDETARIAADAGAQVLSRHSAPKSGKPAALNWAWDALGSRLNTYDAIVVVDADNLVEPNFLSVMNNRMEQGERLIQAYLDTKNPDSSWVAASISLAYWASSRLFQLARTRLGWCSALGGTGLCVERRLLQELGWNADCLAEDLDFQIRALQLGVATCWAHETRTFDEKPTRLRASVRQRLRWIRGHISVALRQIGPLTTEGFRSRRWGCFDAVLYLIQPFRLLLGAILPTLWLAWEYWGHPRFGMSSAWIWSFALLFALHLSQFSMWGFGLLALALERVPARSYMYVPFMFIFGLSWLPIVAFAALNPRGSWTHTKHGVALEISERLAMTTRG